MTTSLNLERTLAVIKPHVIRHRFSIVRRIQIAGFHILQERCVKLTAEQATAFLQSKYDDSKTEMEIESLISGPLIVLCLARQDAIDGWKKLMGPENCIVAKKSAPTSLRAIHCHPDDSSKNAVYGSQNSDDARNDLQFFFPNMILEPFQIGEPSNDYLCSVIYQPLTDAFYEMTKVKPDDPLEWLALFMLKHNQNKPSIFETSHELLQHMHAMKMKEVDDIITEQKPKKDQGIAKCGCLLSTSISITSSTNSSCCKKFH